MNTYKIRVQRAFSSFNQPWGAGPLESKYLLQSLPGINIRELSVDRLGTYTLDVALQRPNHVDAVNEILAALQHAGYTILNGQIAEWTSSAVEGVLVGTLGGGVVGSASGGGWGIALVAAGIGAIAGSIIGSSLRRIEKVYQIQSNHLGGWTITQFPLEALPGMQPGSAAA